MQVLVVLPIYNEEENLKILIPRILAISDYLKILIVIDCSEDGSLEVAKGFKKDNPLRIFIIFNKKRLGRGAAIKNGYNIAVDKEFDLVVEMDADLSHRPEDIHSLLKESEGVDMVIGSRLIKNSYIHGRSFLRNQVTRIGNIYLRFILDSKDIKDMTSGFRCINVDFLRKINLCLLKSNGPQLLQEIIYKNKNNIQIKEVPIVFGDRYQGSSKFSLSIILKSLWLPLSWRINNRDGLGSGRPDLLKEISPEARLTWLAARWLVYGQDLSGAEEDIFKNNVNWEGFIRFASYHELLPSANFLLEKAPRLMPAKESELLKQQYYSSLTYQIYLQQEFKNIAAAFYNKNIEFVPLKGGAFVIDNMYADKGILRPMCDIDLLIKKEALPLAENILKDLGYDKDLRNMTEDYWKTNNYHLPFVKIIKKWLSYRVEIHWALDYARDKPVVPDIWNRLKKYQLEGKEINLLSPEDTLFCLGLHQRRFGKMLCLKNVCDVAMLLNRYNAKFDWDYILKEAKAGNMRATLYFIFAQAKLLLDVQGPPYVLNNLALPKYKQRLIERFILENTFLPDIGLDNGRSAINSLYLKSHFLIHDNFWEPIRCVLNVPQEQFAKFYKLSPYAAKTALLYRIRYFYFLSGVLGIISRATVKRLLNFLNRLLN